MSFELPTLKRVRVHEIQRFPPKPDGGQVSGHSMCQAPLNVIRRALVIACRPHS